MFTLSTVLLSYVLDPFTMINKQAQKIVHAEITTSMLFFHFYVPKIVNFDCFEIIHHYLLTGINEENECIHKELEEVYLIPLFLF